MPIGSFTAVPHFAIELSSRRPARVLDLGIGSGFLGAVVRQWVDEGVRPWRTFLVGVEAWADYRNPLWDLYNLVVVDTIERYLDRHPETFNAVLLGDVLEHFDRDAGSEILGRLKSVVEPGGILLVATPSGFHEQLAAHGNEHERHRSSWSAPDLEAVGFEILLSGHEPQVAYVPTVLGIWEAPW